MSTAQKVIPQKFSLRWKYLKNNGDLSFQKSAKRLHGCHGNIHEGGWVELNFSQWKIHVKKSQSNNSKLLTVQKICCEFGEGPHKVLPWPRQGKCSQTYSYDTQQVLRIQGYIFFKARSLGKLVLTMPIQSFSSPSLFVWVFSTRYVHNEAHNLNARLYCQL